MSVQVFAELSEEDLVRIERLADAATAGPWISYVAGSDTGSGTSCIALGSCNKFGSFESIKLIGGSAADQDFIASARQDVPRLLGEVRALRARLRLLVAKSRSADLQSGAIGGDLPLSVQAAPV